MQTTALSLDGLIELIQPDPQVIADGKRRMSDIWSNRPTDSLPILFSAQFSEPVAGNSDMRRHVTDAEQMLYDWAVGLLATVRAGSDAQLSVRADTGTGTLPTIAGCRQLLSEHALPWTTHITREAIEAFDPEALDFAIAGVMPRVHELYLYFREKLPDCVHLFCADTQGPFDLAHLLYGDEQFYAVYDDPEFMHALLEKTTALYIKATTLMKSWIGEPLDSGYLFTFAFANGGTRCCEDTSTLMSPAMVEEFVLPYQQRALAAFGGGLIHYCGDNEALYQGIVRNPAVRGLNFGNPERHDFSRIIPQLIEAGKCYAGSIDRGVDESLEAYFRRVIGYTGGARKGLVLMPALRGEETADPARVLDLWRSLQ
ncbi:MAG: hypothetical protein ACYDBB_03545 [Armatimonadota bacterium]